jgi:hypothetical protein
MHHAAVPAFNPPNTNILISTWRDSGNRVLDVMHEAGGGVSYSQDMDTAGDRIAVKCFRILALSEHGVFAQNAETIGPPQPV